MRKAFIPESWIKADLKGDTLRTLFAVALHADKNGFSYVRNETLTSITNKATRQIQLDLNKGEKLGLITRKFDESGKRYFVINMDINTDGGILRPAQSNDMVKDCATRNETSGDGAIKQQGVAQSDCAPPFDPPYMNHCISSPYSFTGDTEPTTTTEAVEPALGDKIEPFESGSGPENRSLRIVPRIETRTVEFIPVELGQLKSNFIAVFGPYAEPLSRRIDQAMIDSGFVAWALAECKGKTTPWKLFQHMIKNDWANGAWVSPQKAKQEAKRLAEERNKAFLESLT